MAQGDAAFEDRTKIAKIAASRREQSSRSLWASGERWLTDPVPRPEIAEASSWGDAAFGL
jgi:hypothetical protein